MSETIVLIIEGQVKPGALVDFTAQIKNLVDVTKTNEPDTLIYEYYLADDKTSFQIYERYRNSAATVLHLNSFIEKFSQDFQTVAETTSVKVYGSPDQDVKQILDGFGAIYIGQICGFQR